MFSCFCLSVVRGKYFQQPGTVSFIVPEVFVGFFLFSLCAYECDREIDTVCQNLFWSKDSDRKYRRATFLYPSQLFMNGNDRSQDNSACTYSVLEVMIKLRLLLNSASKSYCQLFAQFYVVSLIIFYVLHEANFTHMVLSERTNLVYIEK